MKKTFLIATCPLNINTVTNIINEYYHTDKLYVVESNGKYTVKGDIKLNIKVIKRGNCFEVVHILNGKVVR